MSSAIAVPPGQHAPFATVTPDDHAAGIIIATLMGIAFTAIVLAVRIFIRRNVNVGWQWDDHTATISTVICWVQSAVVLAACANGLGKSSRIIPNRLQDRVQELYYASNLLYVCAIHLSRTSIILFLHRLTARGSPIRRYAEIMLVFSLVSMVAFFLASALQCGLSQPWKILGDKCPSWFTIWEIQAIVASLTELAIFAMPVWLVWQLQKNLSIRLEIVIWFGLRLIVVIFTICRMSYFDKEGFIEDPTLREATYICLTQAEMGYSIIAATIPAARTLVTDLVTYYNGGGFGSTTSGGDGSRSEAYAMRSLKSSAKRKSENGHWDTARQKAGDASGDGDADSQELIIRKDTTVEISRGP